MKVSVKAMFGAGVLGAMAAVPLQAQGLFGDLPSGDKLERMIEEAEKHPLGSAENPVRAEMPRGQRAYLNRLRCEDGNAPTYGRLGSMGVGPFGRIVDLYEVVCEGSEPARSEIVMDMYHPGYEEMRAVEGFTMKGAPPPPVAEEGTTLQTLPSMPRREDPSD